MLSAGTQCISLGILSAGDPGSKPYCVIICIAFSIAHGCGRAWSPTGEIISYRRMGACSHGRPPVASTSSWYNRLFWPPAVLFRNFAASPEAGTTSSPSRRHDHTHEEGINVVNLLHNVSDIPIETREITPPSRRLRVKKIVIELPRGAIAEAYAPAC